MPIATIQSLDYEGRGVTRSAEGKAVFVDGALPGEEVEYSVVRRKKTYEQAEIFKVIRASAQRVTPKCAFFDKCGGCSMQHFDSNAQAAAKQRVLEDAFWHIARLKPAIIYPAVVGAPWGYRYRARIGVRHVPSKGGVLVGFHEKRSSYIADMTSCQILPPHISDMLPQMRRLIAGLSVPDRVPQIEIAVGDTETVLVFRNLVELSDDDLARLRQFSETHSVQVWLQPAGPTSAYCVHPVAAPALTYSMPEFDVTMNFRPNDFTQVNIPINRVLMRRAMLLLDPQPGERIADLFCGLGNFSLPIARSGATVIGVEGSDALVARAAENARANGLAERTEFYAANLFEATEDSMAAFGKLDKLLIDPPRDGANAVVRALGEDAPRRIVYVSCHPGSLARDAGTLIRQHGYRLSAAGVMDMFPHTAHVESMAVFDRG